MEDRQKVYIKGNRSRGNEIIKLLEDLGGKNTFFCNGNNEDAIYFINPKGDIDNTSNSNTSMTLPYIKEFYKEIKLPIWKPKYNERYYRISWMGTVVEDIWYGSRNDESGYKFGNCFKTTKEAEGVRDKIKNVLNP